MKTYDIVIIGGGPTGIACGIEAQAKGLSYLILEKGYLVNSIYNFPSNMTFFSTSKNLEIGKIPFISHNDKPTRLEALEYYRRIVTSYDLKIKYNIEVESIAKHFATFDIQTNKSKTFKARHIIVATGFYDTPRLLNIPGENLPKVKHYYDDPHPYIGKNIIIIGAANSACDVALETWQKGAKVTMVVRKSKLYEKVKYWILPNIENRIKEGSIKAFFNSEVKEIREEHVLINSGNDVVEIENDYVLCMTGYKPNFDFLQKLGIKLDGENDQRPYINPETLESNVEDLFLAGVIISGLKTSELFIENTREHGIKIINAIQDKSW